MIFPGFVTDTLGFLLLVPLTRKIIISSILKKNNLDRKKEEKDYIEGELVEKNKKDNGNEL